MLTLMINISIIGTVIIKGFEINRTESIPKNEKVLNTTSKPIPIIKHENKETSYIKISSSFMKIRTSKYSY